MQIGVMIVGALGEAAAWWSVSRRRGSVWRILPASIGGAGIAAVLARRPVWAGNAGGIRALLVGLVSATLLYAATRAFVWIATWWEPFRLDVVTQYARAAAFPTAGALALTVAVAAPAEELFWRGLFQAHLAAAWTPALAALATWLAYSAVNVASRSLPIVAAAVVGGGLWAALAWWSGGVLASVTSHILWTGLMLVVPPGAGRWTGGSG